MISTPADICGLESSNVIVCSCNQISDEDVRRCASRTDCSQSPADVYRALGHKPNCGICARTIRSILSDVHAVGDDGESCSSCPVRAQLNAAKARVKHRAPLYEYGVAAE